MVSSWNTSCERLMSVATLLAVFAIASGCGSAGLDVVPVAGKVTLDGKPVADAAVAFVAVEGGHLAHGVTDEQGRFELATTNSPGAVVGEHGVAITKQNVFDPTVNGGIGEIKVEWIVPQHYSKRDTSGLTAVVPSGGTDDLTFELVSQ